MTNWLIPCSPDIYDAEGAFSEYGTIVWHQQCNMAVGDIAYIYITAPVKAIRCKCAITMVDIPLDIGDDEGYTINEAFCSRAYRRYMELKLLEIYDNPLLCFDMLLMNGLNGTIRSQRRVPERLESFIKEIIGENNADN